MVQDLGSIYELHDIEVHFEKTGYKIKSISINNALICTGPTG